MRACFTRRKEKEKQNKIKMVALERPCGRKKETNAIAGERKKKEGGIEKKQQKQNKKINKKKQKQTNKHSKTKQNKIKQNKEAVKAMMNEGQRKQKERLKHLRKWMIQEAK